MKKLILAASIAAALPVFAHADVTIYGSIRAGVSSLKSADTGFKNVAGVDDFNSRIGFKGDEDLGNGLKAIWQVENGLRMDGVASGGSGTGTFANRMSFIGLSGDFGKVRLGYLNDVLTETEATDNLYGPIRDNIGIPFPLYEGSELFGAYGDGRVKNSIRYDSPSWNGFDAILQYGTAEKADHSGNTLGARLAYHNDPTGLFGAYAYMSKAKQAGDKDGRTHRVEFGYDANNLYLAGTYQWINVYGDATALGVANSAAHLKNQSWAINAAYTIGAFKPNFVYSKRKNPTVDSSVQDWGAKQWAVGLDYTVSKRTMLEGGYGQITNNKGAQTALGQTETKSSLLFLMLKHNF